MIIFEKIVDFYQFIIWLSKEALSLGKGVLYWFSTPLVQYDYGDLGIFGDIMEWIIDFLPFADVSPFVLLLSAGLPLFIIFSVVNFFARLI